MSGRYNPYSKYINTDTDWLGEIPVGWRVYRGKFVFKEYAERSETGDETLLSVSEYYGIKPRGDVIDDGDFLSRAESLVGYKKCKTNDLVMNIMLAWKRGLGITKYDGIVSPAYSVFRFNENAYPDYMHYLLRTDIYIDHFKTRSTGVIDSRLRLYPDSFYDVSILLPTVKEQEAIASFLDHETAKIDALIGKQQQLIQLLKEKRQAVISHAVTKGLNPKVKMRDSGVEWLGEIPKHWEIAPLKYLCAFSGGGTPTKDNLSYWIGGNIPWVSPKDMKSFWLSDTQDKVTERAIIESSTNFVETGALLMVVRSGILQRTIPIAINTVRVTLNQDMKALRFNADINVEYAANFILGHEASLLLEWSKEGATVESIELEYLSSGLFPIPPPDEQVKIVQYVKERMKAFQALEENAVLGIALLQERRTALISAAVTGKIDVRSWQPPLDSHLRGNDLKEQGNRRMNKVCV
jgi:type I restriction enzyme, S subunit